MVLDLLAKYKAVHATALDGTVSFPRFAQDQLVRLFNVVSDQREALIEALQRDTGVTAVEAQCEVALTLAVIKRSVDDVDFEKQKRVREAALKRDGAIEKGKGVVVVLGEASSPLYSLVAPLAVAISAGNAAACFLPPATPTVSSILESTMSTALDRSAYLFTTASPDSLASVESAVQPQAPTLTVTSAATVRPPPLDSLVAATGQAGASAVVDRLSPSSSPGHVADIARLLVRGKFHALGRLPGSVARVLVHEDSAGSLLEALLREVEAAFGRDPALSSDFGRLRGSTYAVPDLQKEKAQGARVLCGGARKGTDDEGFEPPTVVSNPSRDLLSRKALGSILPVDTFASHEDLLLKLGELGSNVLYVFADEPVVEYLAFESTAAFVYADDVPLETLYDPGNVLTSRSHYITTSRLVRPAPSAPRSPATGLFAPYTPSRLAVISSLFPRERKLVFKRTAHSNTIRRVFFLQGVFITLGTIVTVLLGGTGWLGWLATKWVRAR